MGVSNNRFVVACFLGIKQSCTWKSNVSDIHNISTWWKIQWAVWHGKLRKETQCTLYIVHRMYVVKIGKAYIKKRYQMAFLFNQSISFLSVGAFAVPFQRADICPYTMQYVLDMLLWTSLEFI